MYDFLKHNIEIENIFLLQYFIIVFIHYFCIQLHKIKFFDTTQKQYFLRLSEIK